MFNIRLHVLTQNLRGHSILNEAQGPSQYVNIVVLNDPGYARDLSQI